MPPIKTLCPSMARDPRARPNWRWAIWGKKKLRAPQESRRSPLAAAILAFQACNTRGTFAIGDFFSRCHMTQSEYTIVQYRQPGSG